MHHWSRRHSGERMGVTGSGRLAVLLAAGFFHTRPVQAATFLVATTQDAPHSAPLDGNCTSTLPGGLCTLRAAVQAANFLGGTQTINLATAATYTLTVTG